MERVVEMVVRISVVITGREGTSTTDDNVERVRQLLLVNRRITVGEVAAELGISHETAHYIISELLQFRKICACLATFINTRT